jgi:antitoxin (DNA-binding transcriptional repressor) of toxin-antitoxin stability system
MKTISVLQFRKNANQIIRWARGGQTMLMTYRGKPVCRLEPIIDTVIDNADPFYSIADMAIDGDLSLDNEDIDRIVYE